MSYNKPSKRKKRNADIENYYKILGTRANATPDTIKQKYIEHVRQSPPETHPEQFQQIRRAYETLRDPHKRSEYDLQRKYGGKLEEMLDEAYELSGQSDWKKASILFMRILDIDASSIPALLGIAHAAMHTDTKITFDEYFERAYECSASEEDKLQILITKARMLYTHDNTLESLTVLERIKATFPQGIQRTFRLLSNVYSELGREEEAWALMSQHIPSIENQDASDIGIFIDWVNLLIDLDKWNVLSNVQQRVRKFLKSLTDENDHQSVLFDLEEEYDNYWDAGRFRAALIFIEFAQFLDPKDEELKEELQDTRELANIEKEVDRMMKDKELFPLITMHAIEWFYEDHFPDNILYSFRNSIPADMLAQLEADNEEYAYGIVRLRKKYPLLYRYYQADWDEIYSQQTAGMNREQRRRIR
ncbi:MAG: DnaJ domain-containing protein [Paenibacillaceae bacterium]